MKKIMKNNCWCIMRGILIVLKEILLQLWQLPQTLVGLLLMLYYRGTIRMSYSISDFGIICVFSEKMKGGISLGEVVIVGHPTQSNTLKHEIGHCKQSRLLGPLYLIVIGIPSVMHASMFEYCPRDPNKYFRYWTEKWADKLGDVIR